MGLLRINRRLQFKISNHGEPYASPHTVSQQENESIYCYKGRKEDERVMINLEFAASISVLGRSHGEGNGNPLWYSCLEIPWTEEPGGLQSIGSQKSQIQLKWLNNHHQT